MSRQAWLALLVAYLLSGGSFYYALHEQAASRKHTVTENCQGQNERNRRTVAEYDKRIARIAPRLPAAQRAQLKQSRAFTVGLIDALAPVRDCSAVLQRAGF